MIYILHYRDDALTNSCIEAAIDQGPILVIDNGSPAPFVCDFAVQVMRLDTNMHIIPAVNEAMRAYPSDWYFSINNDVICAPGCVDKLLAALRDPGIGIVAPGSSDQHAGALYVERPGDWSSLEMAHVDNHAWAWTQDVVDEIGLPDAEGHPHRANWYANRLYCWKARRAGYRCVAVRSAYVDHKHLGGYNEDADRAGYEWICQRMGEQVREVL